MANHFLYLCCCVLLRSWSCDCASVRVPVPVPCAALFGDLLQSTRTNFSDLCHIVTSSNEVTLGNPDTVHSCAPVPTQKTSSICKMQRNSSFSESDCLRNIMRDLAFYDAAIKSYLETDLHRPDTVLNRTLGILQQLRRDCSLTANGGEDSVEQRTASSLWPHDSFKNRQKMCKMMKGLHVRSITINRALGYIASGEHRK